MTHTTLNTNSLRKGYRQMRRIMLGLHEQLVAELPRDLVLKSAETLGIVEDGKISFETEDESSVLMDYCLYDGWSGGHNAVTRLFAREPYPPHSNEMLLLEAMTGATYSLYGITSVFPGLGVEVMDLLREESRFVMDEALSRTGQEGLVMAARLIELPEFSMTTGAVLPVDESTLQSITHALERTSINPGDLAAGALSKNEEAVVASTIIRRALGSGTSSRVRYEELPNKKAPPKHVSPNGPCPCGSGRKFKKCCGQR